MKKLLFLIVLTAMGMFKGHSQALVQTYVDRCTGQVNVFSVPINGTTVVAFYNRSKVFTAQEFQNGSLQVWLEETYLWWTSLSPCSTATTGAQATQQTTQQTTQQATQAATNAAQQSAPTTSVPAPITSTTNAPTTSTSPPPATETPKTTTPDTSTAGSNTSPQDTSTSGTDASSTGNNAAAPGGSETSQTETQSSSEQTDISSSETTESSNETSDTASSEEISTEESTEVEETSTEENTGESSESETEESAVEESTDESTEEELETEETDEESSDQESDEGKEEDGQEKSDEEESSDEKSKEDEEENSEEKSNNKDEEKDDKKKKKKRNLTPPVVMVNAMFQQVPTGEYQQAVTFGISQSSLLGDKTFGANLMVYGNLKQFMLNLNYSKVHINDEGRINRVYSGSVGAMKIYSTYMGMMNHSIVWLGKKGSVKGLAFGTSLTYAEINSIRNTLYVDSAFLGTSLTGFYTKSFNYSPKLTITPMVAVSSPFMTFDIYGHDVIWNSNVMIIGGSNFTYKLTQRFGLNVGVNFVDATIKDFPTMKTFMIGGRMSF